MHSLPLRPYRQGFPLRPLHLGESRPAASPAESHAPALPALRGAPRTSGLNLTDPSSSGAGGCGNAAPLTAATRSASSSSSSARPAKRARLRSGRHLAGAKPPPRGSGASCFPRSRVPSPRGGHRGAARTPAPYRSELPLRLEVRGSVRTRRDFDGNSRKTMENKFSAGAEEGWGVLLFPLSGSSTRCLPTLKAVS